MSAIADWRRLAPRRRSLLPRALILVLGVRLGLLALPFGLLRRILGYARRRGARVADASVERDVAWSVSRAGSVIPGATCLTRALAADLLLARRGLAPTIQIGVRRRGGARLEAHAWVEVDGRIVTGAGGADAYVPLRSLDRQLTSLSRAK